MFDGTLDSVVVLNSRIVGIDSSFSTSLSAVSFPLDFNSTQQAFEIEDVERTRSFEVTYKIQSQFVSEECGARFLFSDLSATSQNGDSLRILSSTPGGNASHIALYRCPRTNVVRVAFRQIVKENIVRDTITILSTNADDLATYLPIQFYKVTGKLSSINLPLDLTSNTTQFIFEVGTEIKTMTFTYDRVTDEVFERCGAQTFITNLQLVSDIGTVESIESTKYKSDSIYDPPKINFAIFQ